MTTKTEYEPWHPDAFLQNLWTRKYRQLMEAAQAQNRVRIIGEHAEHHIVPKSFYRSYCEDGWLPGDWDAPENRVLLTHHEHAQCHIWLWERMTQGVGRRKMALAMKHMLGRSAHRDRAPEIAIATLARAMKEAAEATRDSTIYTWAHKDGRVFIGTRWEVENLAGIRSGTLTALTRTNPKLTRCGWWIVPPGADPTQQPKAKPPKKRNGNPTARSSTVHTFANLVTGQILTGTRWEVEEKAGLKHGTLKHLFGKDPDWFARDWWVVHPGNDPTRPPKQRRATDQPKKRDSTVHTFAHKDGRGFIGTRWELEELAGLRLGALKGLFLRRNPDITCHGWRIVKDAAPEQFAQKT